MKFFKWATDGGEKSGVKGFFLVEIKSLFSIVILKFNRGTREAFHSHAFNAWTWWIKGAVWEHRLLTTLGLGPMVTHTYYPSFKPKRTTRDNCHQVESLTESWAISFRGPWKKTWKEYDPKRRVLTTLTNGRKVIGVEIVLEEKA